MKVKDDKNSSIQADETVNELKAAHTRGPWRLDREGRQHGIEAHFEGEWVQIASMNRTQWGTPHDMTKNSRLAAMQPSNARLMAAAPDLLDALENIFCIGCEKVIGDHRIARLGKCSQCKDARAAIAKATGVQQ